MFDWLRDAVKLKEESYSIFLAYGILKPVQRH